MPLCRLVEPFETECGWALIRPFSGCSEVGGRFAV